MSVETRTFWQRLTGQGRVRSESAKPDAQDRPMITLRPPVEIAPDDPLVAYFLSNPGSVEVNRLNMDSPALRALKEEGVQMAVPLVSQGELIGLLSLGPRLSEQEYSTDDRRLLDNLAAQAAPALRVAQLARQQQAAAAERERIEQELRVARVIQQTLLPKQVPDIPAWRLEAFWQPARAVGGDFYDFIALPDGRLCIIVADVTDKGIPAALVMASARSVLRSAAEGYPSPGQILARANDLLCPDMPPKMFVTCLCVVLDAHTGHCLVANAGHNLPILRNAGGAVELRATGMPLGLMPGMVYEEVEADIAPGERLVLYSDGIVEAHSPQREMFGFGRLQELVGAHHGGALIEHLLADLAGFTGPEWEQEDDVTFLLIKRLGTKNKKSQLADRPDARIIAAFQVDSAPGNERMAMLRIAESLVELNLETRAVDRIKTAVAEATMNAMEHGNQYDPDKPVQIEAAVIGDKLVVHITDEGNNGPAITNVTPDLDLKLAGQQTARGWGLFLIQNMVDELNIIDGEHEHTLELVIHLQGGSDGNTAV